MTKNSGSVIGSVVLGIAGFFTVRYLVLSWARWPALEAHEAEMLAIKADRARQWTAFGNSLREIGVAFGWALVAVVVVTAGAFAVAFILRQYNRAREIDPLKVQRVVLRDGTLVMVDPLRLAGAAIAILPDGTIRALEGPNPEQMSAIAARVRIADVAGISGAGKIANIATGKYLTGALDPRPLPAPRLSVVQPPALPEPPAEPVRLLGVKSAVRESTPERWIVGQNPSTGAVAVFDMARHAHAGIVGATGTGKTSSLGFTLAAEAIAAGCGVTIFDPDGGVNWQHFADVAEWHETDAAAFPDQIAAVHAEYVRRRQNPAQGYTPRVIIIEEYGDLIRQVRARNRATAQTVDGMMDEMLMRARKTGIALVLIDQYPEHWSQSVIAGVKRLFVFKLGPNQGAKVGAYEAQNLPDVGVFMVAREGMFQSFDTRGRVPSLLRMLPASCAPPIIEGSFKRLSITETTETGLKAIESDLTSGTETIESVETGEGGEGFNGFTPSLPPFSESLRGRPKTELAKLACDVLMRAGVPVTINNVLEWALQGGVDLSVGTAHNARKEWRTEQGIA